MGGGSCTTMIHPQVARKGGGLGNRAPVGLSLIRIHGWLRDVGGYNSHAHAFPDSAPDGVQSATRVHAAAAPAALPHAWNRFRCVLRSAAAAGVVMVTTAAHSLPSFSGPSGLDWTWILREAATVPEWVLVLLVVALEGDDGTGGNLDGDLPRRSNSP